LRAILHLPSDAKVGRVVPNPPELEMGLWGQ
jgi:hypothetical protein